jgi:hypothetical protein
MAIKIPTVKEAKERIYKKMEPQLHWRVPFEAGIYQNSPKWSNKGNFLILNYTAYLSKGFLHTEY